MKPASSIPPIVTFRLDPEQAARLAERAARLGLSRQDLARHGVLDMLELLEDLAAASKISETPSHAWVEASFNRN